jgi:pyruvate dehydrogenase E2 component (dihydrolipoamide acetyltransferase)
VAILGSGRAFCEPGLEDGQRHFRLPLSLSYDHRIIDGADGARFLKWVIDAIEEPLLLSLEG